MRFFKPDLSSLGGVFKAPKLGPRHDKMAAHVSESPTTVLLPKGCDDIVNCFLSCCASQPLSFSYGVSSKTLDKADHASLWLVLTNGSSCGSLRHLQEDVIKTNPCFH